MIENINGQTVIKFGTGDIRVTSGIINGEGVLGLNNHGEYMEIGTLTPTVETVETLPNADVYFTFSSVKSIETVILKLQEARAWMINPDAEISKPENITEIYQPNTIING